MRDRRGSTSAGSELAALSRLGALALFVESFEDLVPFVPVYEVHDEVHVLRILHASQRWPPQ